MNQIQIFDIDTPSEAIEFIIDNHSGGESFVGFSGGKDSIVTAELVRMAGIKHQLYYSFTGIDAPEIVQFIRRNYPECIFLRPKKTFWKNLSTNCPPSDRLRWCCNALKKEPAWAINCEHRFMGIRAEESPRRSKQGRINKYWSESKGFIDYYPIFHWKDWQVWEFIKARGLKYPPLYDWGFDRVGCVVCPYHSEKTGAMHKMYRDRWPGYFSVWEKSISKLWYKRRGQGKKMYHKSPEDFLAAWYLDDASRWYAE